MLPAQPGYPWTLRLGTTWVVDADGLRATHRATNLGDRPRPSVWGCTRTSRCPGEVDDVLLTVPGRSRLLLDGRKLPIGAAKVAGGDLDYTAPRAIGGAWLDDAFGDVPDGRLRGSSCPLWTEQSIVTVWADGTFRWWQVFTGDTLPAPRTRRSVAVEPMTCPPDAFHSGRDVDHHRTRPDLAGQLGHYSGAAEHGAGQGGPAAADGPQLRPGPAGTGRGGRPAAGLRDPRARRPASPRAGASWC